MTGKLKIKCNSTIQIIPKTRRGGEGRKSQNFYFLNDRLSFRLASCGENLEKTERNINETTIKKRILLYMQDNMI